jgi:hypothetical protein
MKLAETLPSRNEPASSSSIGSRNQDHAVEYNTGAPYGIDVWPEREVAIVRARALLTHAPVTAGGGGTDGQQPVVSPDELSADGSAFVALSVRLLFELARDTDFRQSQSKEHELSYSDVFGRLLQLLLYCCRDNRFSSKLRISGAACEAVVVLVVDSLGGRLLHQHAGSPVSSALWLLQLLVFVSTNSELGKKYLRVNFCSCLSSMDFLSLCLCVFTLSRRNIVVDCYVHFFCFFSALSMPLGPRSHTRHLLHMNARRVPLRMYKSRPLSLISL